MLPSSFGQAKISNAAVDFVAALCIDSNEMSV